MDSQRRTVRRTEKQAESDLASHIKAKLQEYAHTISSLEDYKALCERRILELAPGHPLPVMDSHLGTEAGRSAEGKESEWATPFPSSQFQSPDSRVNVRPSSDLHSRLLQLEHEKSDLEASLRSEVLHSEEQRAYIEALKQALEAKITSLGLTDISVSEYCGAAQSAEQRQEMKITLAKMQGALINQEDIIQQLKAKVTGLETHSDTEKLRKELDHVNDAFQQAITEMNKLEEEKNSLLDYIQDHKQQETQLQDLLETIEPELISIKQEHEDMRRKYNDVLQELHTSQRSHEQLQTENRELGTLIENLEKNIEDKEEKYENLKENEREMMRELEILQGKNRNLTVNQTTLSETLQETQEELDTFRAANLELGEELKKTQEELGKVEKIEENAANLEKLLKNAQDEISEKDKNNQKFEEMIANLHEKIANLDEFREKFESAEIELASISSKNTEFSRINSEISEKYAELTKSHETVLSELHQNSRLLSKLQEENLLISNELSKYGAEIEKNQREKADLLSKMEVLVQENKGLIGEIAGNRQLEHNVRLELQRSRLEVEEIRGAALRLENALQNSDFDCENPDISHLIEFASQKITEFLLLKPNFEVEIANLKAEMEKCLELIEKREAELSISHQEIDNLRAKLDNFGENARKNEELSHEISILMEKLHETETELSHFSDLNHEKTLKIALLECKSSYLSHENSDLESILSNLYSGFEDSEVGSGLEKVIRCVSELQRLYRLRCDMEYEKMKGGESVSLPKLRSFESQIAATRRNLDLTCEDLKAIVRFERRKESYLASGVNSSFRSESRTLMDRLNLPKVRSEVMKMQSLDSL